MTFGNKHSNPLIVLSGPQVPSVYETKLRGLYADNQQVRKLADEIHARRLLGPPTCDQCIEFAIHELQLEIKMSEGRWERS